MRSLLGYSERILYYRGEMTAQVIDMARKRRTFKLDERLLDALKDVSQQSNTSANNWLETLLIKTFREEGALPKDFTPLVENRGGLRSTTKNRELNNEKH